jgi:hypothetical protein
MSLVNCPGGREKKGKEMEYNVFLSGPRKGQCKLLRDRIIRFAVEGLFLQVVENSPVRTKLKFNSLKGIYLFVGKNGSIRKGRTKTESIDIASVFRKKMEQWEKDNGIFVE